ncbi:MAG: efflux transporter outer membrane subunit [Desulfobacterales bacterium]
MKKNAVLLEVKMFCFNRKMLVLPLFLFLTFLQGCRSVGPDYVPPEKQMPDAWHMELFKGMRTGETAEEEWWKAFADPLLDSLMHRAAEGSLNLKQAYARVNESRASLGYAMGEKLPAVSGKGAAQRQRQGEDFTSPLADNPSNYFSLGLDSSWEPDFWGRIRRSVESAEAGYHASVENYRDVMVRVCAEVASAYTDVRTLQDRIRFAQSNIKAQRESLRITKARVEAGIAPELDVRQAEMNLARTESVLPTLKSALAQSVNRMGILIGKEPEALHGELAASGSIPKPPKEILVPIPANLLRQRPDIRQAERELAAQTARIGIATAALYPTFTLSGSIGLEAGSGLFDAASRYWSFGPSLRWNLFDGGRVRSQIQAEEARTVQALAAYEQTVLSALEDVENSLAAYANESIRLDTLKRSVAAARKSVTLVQSLYKTGLADFQNVLDTERTLFEQQDALAASQGQVTQNLIRLYKAIGGGWKADFSAEREKSGKS